MLDGGTDVGGRIFSSDRSVSRRTRVVPLACAKTPRKNLFDIQMWVRTGGGNSNSTAKAAAGRGQEKKNPFWMSAIRAPVSPGLWSHPTINALPTNTIPAEHQFQRTTTIPSPTRPGTRLALSSSSSEKNNNNKNKQKTIVPASGGGLGSVTSSDIALSNRGGVDRQSRGQQPTETPIYLIFFDFFFF